MVCTYCGHATKVTNSRELKREHAIWRRRFCPECGATVTTTEQVALTSAVMVENSKAATLLPFNRDVLFLSIYESCRHRATAIHDATGLTATAIKRLLGKRTHPALISRNDITRICHELLTGFDHTAATLYAAYHSLD